VVEAVVPEERLLGVVGTAPPPATAAAPSFPKVSLRLKPIAAEDENESEGCGTRDEEVDTELGFASVDADVVDTEVEEAEAAAR